MALSHEAAKRFYDRFGARQDWQRFYEDRAITRLLGQGALTQARAVVEFGCGTGRIAQRLLERELPPTAHYLALDHSDTMVSLAAERLRPYAPRAEVIQTSGAMALPAAAGSFDRFLSTYVLDLLAQEDIHALLGEAYRVLQPQGLLLLASLGHGCSRLSRLLEKGWQRLYTLRPAWVGGCRPLALTAFIDHHYWQVRHHSTVVQFGLATEVVVAARRHDHARALRGTPA